MRFCRKSISNRKRWKRPSSNLTSCNRYVHFPTFLWLDDLQVIRPQKQVEIGCIMKLNRVGDPRIAGTGSASGSATALGVQSSLFTAGSRQGPCRTERKWIFFYFLFYSPHFFFQKWILYKRRESSIFLLIYPSTSFFWRSLQLLHCLVSPHSLRILHKQNRILVSTKKKQFGLNFSVDLFFQLSDMFWWSDAVAMSSNNSKKINLQNF